MDWQKELGNRLSSGSTYTFDGKFKVQLLQSVSRVKGYGGHGGAIFANCRVLTDYSSKYSKGSTHRLNAEFLR